jgi:hypothetical protein
MKRSVKCQFKFLKPKYNTYNVSGFVKVRNFPTVCWQPQLNVKLKVEDRRGT